MAVPFTEIGNDRNLGGRRSGIQFEMDIGHLSHVKEAIGYIILEHRGEVKLRIQIWDSSI